MPRAPRFHNWHKNIHQRRQSPLRLGPVFFWAIVCIFFRYWLCVWCEEFRMTTLGRRTRELFPPHHQIPAVITSVEGNLVLKTICHAAIVPPASGISNDPALGCVMGSWFGATGWKAVNVSVPLCCLIYFVFKVNRTVPVLWELVIDVAIVSPAPAGAARRGRSVLGRGRLHPGPSTQLRFSFWPGCTWSRTKPIIVKYSMPHTSGVTQKSSNLLNRCCWHWCSWDHWWIHGSPKVTACRTSTESRIESQNSSSHQAFTVKSATVWEHFSFSQILVFLVIFLTLKHNTSFSWFKNHFVYPLAGVLSMQMQVNH